MIGLNIKSLLMCEFYVAVYFKHHSEVRREVNLVQQSSLWRW